MNLQPLKDKIASAGFSDESREVLTGIIDNAASAGGLSAEDVKRIQGIVGVEKESLTLQADMMEDAAGGLETFVQEIDAALAEAETKIEEVQKELS